MKKLLLTAILSSALCGFTNAQQLISFETSEGFHDTNLDGEQGWNVWSTWGELDSSSVGYDSTTATHGQRSAYVESAGWEMDWCGLEKNISHLIGDKTEISFDYKFDDIGYSNYSIDLYQDESYDITAGFQIDYNEGRIYYYSQSLGYEEGEVLQGDQWYRLKVVIDKSAKNCKYYINDVLKYETQLPLVQAIGILDFSFDDYGSGFHVDRITIINQNSTLGQNESFSEKDVVIYPNPVADKLFLKGGSLDKTAKIYDASGKLVGSATKDFNSGIDVSHLSKGSYLISIESDTKTISKKFIKK